MAGMGGKRTLAGPVRVSSRHQRRDCCEQLRRCVWLLNNDAVRNAICRPIGRTVPGSVYDRQVGAKFAGVSRDLPSVTAPGKPNICDQTCQIGKAAVEEAKTFRSALSGQDDIAPGFECILSYQ